MVRTVGISVFLLFLLPGLATAETPFQGRACISLEEEPDLRAARLLAHGAAIRRALEATGVLEGLRAQGSPDHAGDLLQVIRSGHLEDVRVLEHTESDGAVCETVEVQVDPEALRQSIRNFLDPETRAVGESGLERNGCLQVLSIEEEEDRYGRRVTVTARALRSTGPLHTPEHRRSRPCFKVCIDYYGPGGVPLDGDARFVDESAEGLLRGEIRTLPFHAPEEVQSYRVWLPAGPEDRRSAPRKAARDDARDRTSGAPDQERLRTLEALEAESDAGGLRLEVVSNGPVTRHTQFYMDGPPRLVIDLPGRWRRPGFHARRLESNLVKRVRIGYHPGKLRLVLDLTETGGRPAAVIRETPEGMAVEVRSR
jgi:hypothetical protein